MRNTFVHCLLERAKDDDRIFVITPDMGYSVFERFAMEHPEKFLNVGIAEQNAIGVAAGLALSGKIVYVYSIIPFVTMRCFEQVRIDVAYMNTNVRLVGVGAGLTYGPAGASHHAIEDIAIMKALPNMSVCCPGDPIEVRELIQRSFSHQGPIYFRLGKTGEPKIHSDDTHIEIGKAIWITQGNEFALISTSNMLQQAKKWVYELNNQGKSVALISMPTIKPLDVSSIQQLIEQGISIITLEEHNTIGGLGSSVAEVIAASNKCIKFRKIAIEDKYCHSIGRHSFLREHLDLMCIRRVVDELY